MTVIDHTKKRLLFVNNIARDPESIIFMPREGDSITTTCRLGQVSMNKKVSVAGFTDDIADLECAIALPVGTAEPLPNYDFVEIDSLTYRILEVQPLRNADCYLLTLKLDNE